KNSLNRPIRCVCGKKIGPDPRNFNQRVSLGRNDLLIRTFLSSYQSIKTHVNTLLSTQKNILFSFKSPFSAIKKHQTVILLARR
ncbi:hypothetical protein, partial [Escherichia coli]|uniref:hypothetical protein n=1 Tax=Escherichia coli TaxID=562 RepID=UPI00197ABA29